MTTPSNITIFVINLAKSKDRRQMIIDKFAALPERVNYQFFEGVYGKDTPDHPLFSKHNAAKRALRKGSKTTLGQLGCFASHYLLWEKCVELDQGIIVMEDDAILLDNFLNTYHFVNSPNNIYEFLWLCQSYNKSKSKLIKREPTFHLEVKRFYKGWGNAACYYLTPKAAKKLLDYTKEWIFDVDISMDRYYENKLDFYGVLPPCVTQDTQLESNIPHNKCAESRTFLIRLRREYFATMDRLHRLIYNLTH